MKPTPDVEQEDSRVCFWTQTLSLFSSRIEDTEQGISVLLPSQKLRDGTLALLRSFSLQEGELLRVLKLILSRIVVIRSWVSLICWKGFLYAGVVYMFLRVKDPVESL